MLNNIHGRNIHHKTLWSEKVHRKVHIRISFQVKLFERLFQGTGES